MVHNGHIEDEEMNHRSYVGDAGIVDHGPFSESNHRPWDIAGLGDNNAGPVDFSEDIWWEEPRGPQESPIPTSSGYGHGDDRPPESTSNNIERRALGGRIRYVYT